MNRTVHTAAVLGAVAVLAGCATGQDSLVAISPPAGLRAPLSDDDPANLDLQAPNLLAASGTALLAGARGPAISPGVPLTVVAGTIGPASLAPGANTLRAEAAVAPAPAGPAAVTATVLSGPLLAVNGSTGALLGGRGVTAVVGAAPAQATALPVAAGASLQVAPTQLAVSATAAVNRTSGTVATPPLTAPVVSPNPGLVSTAVGLLPPVPVLH